VLTLDHICATYQDHAVLDDICLDIDPKIFYGIIGPNGVGKTTLLRIMTGIKFPASGEVRLNGRSIRTLSRKQIAKTMAVVPQSSFIPPLFTVEEVVSMGRYPHQESRFSDSDTDRACVVKALQQTGIFSFRGKPIGELSGGQRQEVIITRALAQEPRLLMLDEPTANLDIKHQMKILGLTRNLVQEKQMAAVMVIHNLNLAARFCDQLVLLHDRKILAAGSPVSVLTPEHLKIAYEVDTVVRKNPLTRALDIIVLDSRTDLQETG
jgi:iron complex transport system ATP-binding protein